MASIKNRRGQNRVKPVTAFVMLISALYLGTLLHHLLAVQRRMGVNRQAEGVFSSSHQFNLVRPRVLLYSKNITTSNKIAEGPN